ARNMATMAPNRMPWRSRRERVPPMWPPGPLLLTGIGLSSVSSPHSYTRPAEDPRPDMEWKACESSMARLAPPDNHDERRGKGQKPVDGGKAPQRRPCGTGRREAPSGAEPGPNRHRQEGQQHRCRDGEQKHRGGDQKLPDARHASMLSRSLPAP